MKRIGKYEIVGLLGRGGMGAVYKVRNPLLGSATALKLFKPADELCMLVGKKKLKEQFREEAARMAGLNHPNIAAVYDYDEAAQGPFYTMEFLCWNIGLLIGEHYVVENPSRRLPPEKALDLCIQTLKGLDRMHAAKLVHRDVKPFNILLTWDDRVKLIDFGLSRLRGEVRESGPSGVKIGTPYYASPEQERDPDSVDGAADCWSVGVMLHRLLTGLLPKDGGYTKGPTLPQSGLIVPDSDVEVLFDEFFLRALNRDPQARFQRAGDMIAALNRLGEALAAYWEGVCRFFDQDEAAPAPSAAKRFAPRCKPKKTGPDADRACDILGLDDLGRPKAVRPVRLEPNDAGEVVDAVNGLVWERSGSPYPLDYAEALEHAAELGGAWRLPTVEEAALIVRPDADERAICTEPVFGRTQRAIWTADRRTHAQAWCLHTEMGFFSALDLTCPLWVRAVRSL